MAISNADGSIVLTTRVDQSGLKRGMSTMKSGISSLTGTFGKLASAIGVAFSVGALVKFGKEASSLATKTEASVQRLIDIYGEASKAVGDFIDANANALGMSRSAAASYASVYGNLFSVWADQKTNAELTNRYLQMTAVVASKTGRTVEDVQERIRSGLLGNTEAIEDLGVFVNVKTIEMTDAFQRMANGRSWEQLDAYAQQQIRSMAILEQATAKYGNEVAQTTALTKSQFSAAWQDFQATWGQVINKVLMPVLEVLTKILTTATAVTQTLFGISKTTISESDAIANATSNQKELTEAVKETEKATKKALAGFDDLQIISSGASENAPLPSVETQMPTISESFPEKEVKKIPKFLEQIYDEAKKISDLFMEGFWQGFQNADFSSIKQSLSGIKESLQGIFASSEVQTSIQGFISSVTMAFGQVVGSIASIGTTVATNLLGGFNQYLQTNSGFIQTSIANIFDASSRIATAVGNMWGAFANIFSAFASENGQTLTGHIIGIFSNAGLGIIEWASKIGADFIEMLTQPIIDNQEQLKGALDGVLGVFSDVAETISELITDLFKDINELYDKHIAPLIDTITEVLSELVGETTEAFNEHILPVLQDFAKEFENVVENHLKPMFEEIYQFISKVADLLKPFIEDVVKPIISYLIDVLVPTIGSVIKTVGNIINRIFIIISDIVGDIIDVFSGLIDFIVGVFTGNWEKAWQGIKDAFRGVANLIVSIFEGAINLIIGAINLLISGIDAIVGVIGDIFGQQWNVPKIPEVNFPRLAQGAVIPPNREFLAVLGDQKQGVNIEAPLDTIVEAFNIALAQNGGTNRGNTEVVLEIDGREFGRAVVEQGNRENRRIGTRLVIV